MNNVQNSPIWIQIKDNRWNVFLAICCQASSSQPYLSGTHWSLQMESLYRQRVAVWCSAPNRPQLLIVGARDWETGKMLTLGSRFWSLINFFFLLQKSKRTHVTPHAIPALSMYDIHLYGGEGRKWGPLQKIQSILLFSEGFSAV